MNQEAIKNLLYGGLLELTKHSQFYYKSGVNPEYSHFTDAGAEVAIEYLNRMCHLAHNLEVESLNNRAKQMVINGLKGENN